MPRAWVEDMRENVLQFAGGHSEAMEAYLAEIAPVKAELANMINSARVQLKRLDEMASKELSGITALGRKVEKEIGR